MTNRQRLLRIGNDLGKIMEDPGVGTAYFRLSEARKAVMKASQYALDNNELNILRSGGKIDGFSY